MNKRQIILDFTALLDVIMIILFFFILFSHLETKEEKQALQAAQQSAIAREQEAEKLLSDAGEMLAQAEEKDKLAEDKLSEAEAAGLRSGKNTQGIYEFGQNLNLRIYLKKTSAEEWKLYVCKTNKEFSSGEEIEKNFSVTLSYTPDTNEMSKSLSEALKSAGCKSDATLLCVFVYNGLEGGTKSVCDDIENAFKSLRSDYKYFYYSEIDTSFAE